MLGENSNEKNHALKDLSWREIVVFAPLVRRRSGSGSRQAVFHDD